MPGHFAHAAPPLSLSIRPLGLAGVSDRWLLRLLARCGLELVVIARLRWHAGSGFGSQPHIGLALTVEAGVVRDQECVRHRRERNVGRHEGHRTARLDSLDVKSHSPVVDVMVDRTAQGVRERPAAGQTQTPGPNQGEYRPRNGTLLPIEAGAYIARGSGQDQLTSAGRG